MNFKVKKIIDDVPHVLCIHAWHACMHFHMHVLVHKCTTCRVLKLELIICSLCVAQVFFFLSQSVGWCTLLVGPRNESAIARQTMLFGTVVENGQFFKGLPSADDDAGYYAAVEVLWTLDKSN